MNEGWYYIQTGLIDDQQVGPLSNKEVLDLLTDETIKPKTKLSHPKHTAGEWLPLSEIRVLQTQIDKIKAIKAEQQQQKRDMREQAERERRQEEDRKRREREEEQRQVRAQRPPPTPIEQPSRVVVVQPVGQRISQVLLIGGWILTAVILAFLYLGFLASDSGAKNIMQQIGLRSDFTANVIALYVLARCADKVLRYFGMLDL